jgi:anti-anti-sigma factor
VAANDGVSTLLLSAEHTQRAASTERLITLAGELDLATRGVAYDACVGEEGPDVIVDLGNVSFLDCAGYGALMAARRILQSRGGSLTVRNATGEPARLLFLRQGAGAHITSASATSSRALPVLSTITMNPWLG